MTAPFVTELRAGGDVIVLGGGDAAVLHLRSQSGELWDTIRVDAPASATVTAVKRAALDRFYPNGANPDDFVVKVRGFEILHEDDSLQDSGVRDGSTLLISRRKRTPVR